MGQVSENLFRELCTGIFFYQNECQDSGLYSLVISVDSNPQHTGNWMKVGPKKERHIAAYFLTKIKW